MKTVEQLFAELPEADRLIVAERFEKVERLLDRRRQSVADRAIAEAVIRILEHPAHQRLADRLRDLLK